MRCAQITIAYIAGVSSIQSCFSQVSVLVNRHRAGIALISPTHLYILLNGMLATYSIKTNAQLIFVHWQLIIGCSFVCYIWKTCYLVGLLLVQP